MPSNPSSQYGNRPWSAMQPTVPAPQATTYEQWVEQQTLAFSDQFADPEAIREIRPVSLPQVELFPPRFTGQTRVPFSIDDRDYVDQIYPQLRFDNRGSGALPTDSNTDANGPSRY